MDCPHCGRAFHDQWNESGFFLNSGETENDHWQASGTVCPACKNPTIELKRVQGISGGFACKERIRVYPIHNFRAPTPKEVPAEIARDYEEACTVLPIS